MASGEKNLSDIQKTSVVENSTLSFGIVQSVWNSEITNALLEGCTQFLLDSGVKDEDIHSIQVPGSFELPSGARLLIANKKLDAVICLGCIIKGETKHDEYISRAVAQGLINLSLHSNVPCAFGVLTTNDIDQARERAGGKHGNKGVEAAGTALEMAKLRKTFRESSSKIGFGQ